MNSQNFYNTINRQHTPTLFLIYSLISFFSLIITLFVLVTIFPLLFVNDVNVINFTIQIINPITMFNLFISNITHLVTFVQDYYSNIFTFFKIDNFYIINTSYNGFFLCIVYYIITIVIMYVIVNFTTTLFNIFNKLISPRNSTLINIIYTLFR